ncbi:MAG: adenine methyltransferase, partial [Patescibacteria group bacterium]|nr:adenine methyltransferase [Patescibacteria group bacterium]
MGNRQFEEIGKVGKAFSHERTKGRDEWLTPKFITDALAPFELDPCASIVRPWEIAPRCFTREDNGLLKSWENNFVFCNPPYGNETQKWFRRMAEHNHGIALTFARTETRMF